MVVLPPPAGSVAAEGRGAELELVGQPAFYGPGDSLGLRLEVSNSGPRLNGFEVTVAAFGRVDSRSSLHETFDGPQEFPSYLASRSFDGRTLARGESTSVRMNQPLSQLHPLALGIGGGAYPLSVELYDADRTRRLDSVVTYAIYFPDPPESPVNLVLVVPLSALPQRGPGGAFAGPDGGLPYHRALGEGWLGATLGSLERLARPPATPEPRPRRDAADRSPARDEGRNGNRSPPGPRRGERDRAAAAEAAAPHRRELSLAVAPTPRLVEELDDMADGYRLVAGGRQVPGGSRSAQSARRLLDALEGVLADDGVQPLLTPYAFADLPSIERHLSGPQSPAASQLNAGELVLSDVLPSQRWDREWVLPPEGRLDASTLEALHLGDAADGTFFSEDSLRSGDAEAAPGCPRTFASFTCPVEVTTPAGTTRGYVIDGALQERLDAVAQSGGDRVDLQRLLAEIATIWAELPGTQGRVVGGLLPATWRPGAQEADALFGALAKAPWIRTVTPSRGLRLAGSPAGRAVVNAPSRVPGAPRASFYVDLEDAEATIASFDTIGPPRRLVERLERDLLVAQSRLWWESDELKARAAEFVLEAKAEAGEHLGKVDLASPNRITLTSRRGEIQFEVLNRASYPVRVDIVINSPELALFDQRLTRRVPAGKQLPVTVTARAETSGTYSLDVSLETRDGRILIDNESPAVTSTVFNRIALGVTIGALLFLVMFYMWRGIRRRGERSKEPPANAPAT